jgi:hypothetical protein
MRWHCPTFAFRAVVAKFGRLVDKSRNRRLKPEESSEPVKFPGCAFYRDLSAIVPDSLSNALSVFTALISRRSGSFS